MEDYVTKLLARDLPEEMFSAFANRLHHEYDAAYRRLAPERASVDAEALTEMELLDVAAARRSRRENGKRAMLHTCRQLGIPHEVRALKSNGQIVVLAQVGELLLFPEPMDYLEEKPVAAAYKQELAASHFAERQLEFDFGDRYRRTQIDCRNTMLVVLQHGMRGERFDEKNLKLSMLRVAVPDWSFSSWTWRANAMNDELSLLMDWKPVRSSGRFTQEDKVQPMLKSNLLRKMEDGQ
ncbi:hypothetical protein [Rhodobacter maris]|uniref:Uncharacterized protein n=1 Tax=Rhodobacter maris TaxID=446682 RepID=A0A285TJI0_9RHOB|nr:hypothetical protein [Rhodobacter maris]SOC20641.1 hypothetical protein SAMN05877831_12018 [Rhodobacter maris]